jgi:4-azaleucine resistance transporter AzlC
MPRHHAHASPSLSPRQEFLAGMRDQLPILIGVAPFGMIFGALAIGSGLNALQAQAFSLFIFAGSAQFIALGLLSGGAPTLIVILTILVVNLRHLLYSASLAPRLAHLPLPWRAGLAWLLTDEAFALTSVRYRRPDLSCAHWYMLGCGLALWASWQVSTALGLALGAYIPQSLQLDFALPLTFLGLLTLLINTLPSLAAALLAGLLALALAGLPYRLHLLLGAMGGIGCGLLVERIQSGRGIKP